MPRRPGAYIPGGRLMPWDDYDEWRDYQLDKQLMREANEPTSSDMAQGGGSAAPDSSEELPCLFRLLMAFLLLLAMLAGAATWQAPCYELGAGVTPRPVCTGGAQ